MKNNISPIDVRLSQLSEEVRQLAIEEIKLNLTRMGLDNESFTNHVLKKDMGIMQSFDFEKSKQGHEFWFGIIISNLPGKPGQSLSQTIRQITGRQGSPELLAKMVKEAELRGFKVGAITEHGQINNSYEHELLEDGTFYYHNIKVFDNGRWIGVNKTEETKKSIDSAKSLGDAIDEFIELMRRGELEERVTQKRENESSEFRISKDDDLSHPFDRFEIGLN